LTTESSGNFVLPQADGVSQLSLLLLTFVLIAPWLLHGCSIPPVSLLHVDIQKPWRRDGAEIEQGAGSLGWRPELNTKSEAPAQR